LTYIRSSGRRQRRTPAIQHRGILVELIDAKIGGISRRRNPEKLIAYAHRTLFEHETEDQRDQFYHRNGDAQDRLATYTTQIEAKLKPRRQKGGGSKGRPGRLIVGDEGRRVSVSSQPDADRMR
jgi:hypothetical protein